MKRIQSGVLLLCLLLFASCGTSRHAAGVDYTALARAGIALGLDIDEDDDRSLMLEAASWIGVRYRYAGNDRRGVDCSGLTYNIYRTVYGIQLQRSSEGMYEEDVDKISKRKLKSGDLVFFGTGKKRRKVNHVGIYLKDGAFIHTSNSSGVIVSRLDEEYYRKRYIKAGRVKKWK